MKISMIAPYFYPATVYGGPTYSVLAICKSLASLDVDVYVSTTNANGKVRLDTDTSKFQKFANNIFVHYHNDIIIRRFSLSFIKSIKKEITPNDLVHINSVFTIPASITLFYAKKINKPVVLSPRGAFSLWALTERKWLKDIFVKFITKPLIKNVYWLATSVKEKDDILRIIPKARIKIIPNGIVPSDYLKEPISKNDFVKKFSTIIIDKININDINIIVSMGRLHKSKGFDILIRSFSLVLKENPNSLLFIAGSDFGELDNLKKLCKQLGVEHKVSFVGQVEGSDKIDFLTSADVFALSSHSENFGNVYTESLAAGTPIVASKATPWEVVEKNNCGKWVENTDINFADAINYLLSEDKNELRVNSRNLAREYDWANIGNQINEVYKELINERTK